MALPKHNTFLRWFYILCVIGMFIFMSMVIRGYFLDDTVAYQAKGNTTKTDEAALAQLAQYYASEQEGNSAKRALAKKAGLVDRPALNILARTFVLDLQQPVNEQISAFWLQLFNDEILLSSSSIVTNKTLYQVYRNYNPVADTVEVFVGFRINTVMSNIVNDSQYKMLTLAEGLMLPRKSVLDSWQNYDQLPIKLSYEFDYDVFQLNARFDVISQKAFLNPKSGGRYE